MNEQVTVGLVQMAMGEDREANVEKAFAMARTARERGAELIVFPEIFNGIYFCKYPAAQRYNAWAETVPDGPLCTRLAELARELRAVVIGSIFEFVQDGLYFNTAVVFEADGGYLGKSRKMHIPETGPGYQEKYYFAPGDSDYPVFHTSLIDVATPTCWDQWYPEVARLARLKGAEPSSTRPASAASRPTPTSTRASRGRSSCAVTRWPTRSTWPPATGSASKMVRRSTASASSATRPAPRWPRRRAATRRSWSRLCRGQSCRRCATPASSCATAGPTRTPDFSSVT